jgi:hypothetical protein
MQADLSRAAVVLYRNYKDEKAIRLVVPVEGSLRFGTNEWHTKPQWLIKVYDTGKKEEREFSLEGISCWCNFETPKICTCPGGFNSDSEEETPAEFIKGTGQLVCPKCSGTRGGVPSPS